MGSYPVASEVYFLTESSSSTIFCECEQLIFRQNWAYAQLRPSINGPVTDGNTNLCRPGFILALFQSTTANKIDSEHTRDYKRLLPVWEAEILRVTVKRIDVFPSFYVDF